MRNANSSGRRAVPRALIALFTVTLLASHSVADDSVAGSLSAQERPYCGPYVLHALALHLGKASELDALVRSGIVQSSYGASVADLAAAARDLKLEIEPATLSIDQLKSRLPAVLHVRTGSGLEPDHFILALEQTAEGIVTINPPGHVAVLTDSHLAEIWEGLALASGQPDFLARFLSSTLAIIICMICLRITALHGRSTAACISLGILIASWLTLTHAAGISGPSASGGGAFIALGESSPSMTPSQLSDELAQRDPPIVLDVRSKTAFDRGTIEGAIWIDIDRPLEEQVLRGVTARLRRELWDLRYVVFCGSNECGSARTTATRLNRLGFDDVQILDDGWRSWKERDGFSR